MNDNSQGFPKAQEGLSYTHTRGQGEARLVCLPLPAEAKERTAGKPITEDSLIPEARASLLA